MSSGRTDANAEPPRWQRELFERRTAGVRLGLERIRRVWSELEPSRPLPPVVQIVGTNGKGSTAAMLDHGLKQRGIRAGTFTSPHLHRIGERIRVDGTAVTDETVRLATRAVLAVEARLGERCTFFEVLTAAALHVFAERGVSLIVLEAGLGGRLDSTRVVAASVHAVTPIGLDHQAYLGDTLEAIAAEKLAVLAARVPCFAARQAHPELEPMIERHARAVGAELVWADPSERAPMGLPGAHQRGNAGLALAILRHFAAGAQLSDLDGVCWPGRYEWHLHGEGAMGFDVAHNELGIAALVRALEEDERWMAYDASRRVIVFGAMADKRPERLLDCLLGHLRRNGGRLWVVPPPREGAMQVEEQVPGADRVFESAESPELREAIAENMARGGAHIVCGSHFLVAALRADYLNIPAGERDGIDLSDPLARGVRPAIGMESP